MAEEKKFDPFKLEAPKVPGVAPGRAPAAAAPEEAEPAGPGILPAGARLEAEKRQIPVWVWPVAGAGGLLALLILYFLLRPAEKLEQVHEDSSSAVPAASAPGSPAADAPAAPGLPIAPQEDVATVQEMAEPWSSKKFLFAKSSGGTEPALLVRLPGNAGYWAFATRPQYGKCDLEVVTDRDRLRGEFRYSGSGPMVVDPCEKVVYNPMAYGHVRGVMIRGDVAQGPGFRPPIAIEVRVNGNRIQAVRMENQ
jgi:hypothetical protein